MLNDNDPLAAEENDLIDTWPLGRQDEPSLTAEDPNAMASSSVDHLLSALPRQTHSVQDGVLKLGFEGGKIQENIDVSLSVDASPGCGGVAWPAGQILSNYLVQKGPSFLSGKNILELGSGTGLVGIVAGYLGGKVWITDQAPLLNIMRRNVSMNNLDSSVAVEELNWGSPIPGNIPKPDIVLAADCVYFEPAFPLLVKTLNDLAGPTTETYFCYKKRRKADKRFFVQLKKKFSWKEVDDDPTRGIYTREGITLLQLSKINPSGA